MEISKTRKTIGWTIASLLSALYIFSAYGKFANPEQMEAMKLGDWRIVIAIGELVSAILFLLPKTNKIGLLLLSSYMGGAIILHMTGGISMAMPTVVLFLVWVNGFIRNPEFTKFSC